jgi:hypothetical protein
METIIREGIARPVKVLSNQTLNFQLKRAESNFTFLFERPVAAHLARIR